MINDQGKSRQIDHIAITEYGVFVIETKNYAGAIYGKEDSTEWQQYLRNRCFTFKNPIHQNYGHKKIVEELLQDKNVYVEPIVVFISRCKLKVETKSKVLYDNQLVNYINKKEKILSENEVDQIYNIILENRVTNEEKIQDHEYNVRKYIEYKNKIADSGKCPRCGGNLVLRKGKNGNFYGCYNYPKCKYTKNV